MACSGGSSTAAGSEAHDAQGAADAEPAGGGDDGGEGDAASAEDAGFEDGGAEDAGMADSGGEPDADAPDAAAPDASVGQALYVEPSAGDDGQPGTLAQPFKTIAHAASVAQSGDTIWLLDGSYAPATEPRFEGADAAPCGAFSGIVVPTGVTVRALHDGLAVLRVSAPHGFCMTGGALIGLDLGHAQAGGRIVEVSAGAVLIVGTRFTNTGTGGGGNEAAIYATGTAEVTVRPDSLDNLLGAPSYGFAAAREHSRVTISGATLKGSLSTGYSGNALLVATDAAELVLEDVRVSEVGQPVVLSLSGQAKATLRNGTALVGPGVGSANNGIHMVGNSTLVLDGASITDFLAGIYSSIYEPNNPTIAATDAVIAHNNIGVNLGGDTSPLLADCRFVRGRIEANVGAGLRSNIPGSYRFDGTVITINGTRGLDFWNKANDYDVTLRGTSLLGNGTSGLYFAGSAGSSLDLGTLAEPGQNTLTGNNGKAAANESSVRLDATGLLASAVGNRWNGSVQGASAAGTYGAAGAGAVLDVTISNGSGTNFSVAAGTLRLAANP